MERVSQDQDVTAICIFDLGIAPGVSSRLRQENSPLFEIMAAKGKSYDTRDPDSQKRLDDVNRSHSAMRTNAYSIFHAPIGSIGRTLLNLWALLSALAMLAASFPISGARAQEAAAAPAIALELNGALASEKGCRFTFVVTNGLKAELERAAYEIALFDAGGVVDRLAVLDFKELPAGKTKVTRFDLAGVDCAGISRILVNGSTACVGAGVEPTACMRQLDPRSKTAIQFGI